MKIQVDLADVKRVFRLLENIHELMHEPLRYSDSSQVEAFAAAHYAEIKELYYETVWNWLPQEVKQEIIEE